MKHANFIETYSSYTSRTNTFALNSTMY